MNSDARPGDGEYQCPYPDCDWTPSHPVDSDVALTQAVINKEISDHRTEHK